MSTALPARPRQTTASAERVAIVASRYNLQYVQGLVENATHELYELSPQIKIQLFQVPGSFEIPLMVSEVIRSATARWDAVIALGVILRGATRHADFVAESVTSALMDIAIEQRTPVIHEVLLLENEEQARQRCLQPELNRGVEAARSCLSIIRSLADLRPAPPKTNR